MGPSALSPTLGTGGIGSADPAGCFPRSKPRPARTTGPFKRPGTGSSPSSPERFTRPWRRFYRRAKCEMADREGFEPSVTLLPHTLSKRAHSTTLTPALGREGGDPTEPPPAWQANLSKLPANPGFSDVSQSLPTRHHRDKMSPTPVTSCLKCSLDPSIHDWP